MENKDVSTRHVERDLVGIKAGSGDIGNNGIGNSLGKKYGYVTARDGEMRFNSKLVADLKDGFKEICQLK